MADEFDRIHVATIVAINGLKYLVDTNVGPAASPFPVPLVHDEPVVDVWHRQRRMIFDTVPGMVSEEKWWRLQVREPTDKIWMDVCCFTEMEWLPIDFEIMVMGMGQLGLGWFKSLVLCFRIILEDGAPVGYLLMLHDEVRRLYKGKLSVTQKLYTEEDRVRVLKTEFGAVLSNEERRNILGTVGELKDEGYDFYG